MRWLRRTLLLIIALALCGLGYDAATRAGYSGTPDDRFDGATFYSASYARKKPGDVLRWSLNRDQGPWEQRPTPVSDPIKPRVDDGLRITLVNHSTLLIQTGQLNLLTDPIWSPKAGPFGRLGPGRFREPGIAFDALPPIDVVFVSHSHYDHMDLPTLRRLFERDTPRFVVALGNAGNLAKVGIDAAHVIELDWWQSVELNTRLTLHLTPAQHWSKRTALDTNRTLWGSFVLTEGDEARVFFAGDTGYAEHFTQIADRYGALDVALMPIGAYLPRWFMKDNHLSPEEALKAAEDLRTSVMIPMHFGTFALGDDGQDEPLTRLHDAYALTRPARPELHILDNAQAIEFNLTQDPHHARQPTAR